jgi:hypothetical protein
MLSEREMLERAFAAIDALAENRAADREVEAVSDSAQETSLEPKTERLADLAEEAPGSPFVLKGQAVEMWRAGERFLIVADQDDAQEVKRRFGVDRGEIWTSEEIELVSRFEDQESRERIALFKRSLFGSLSPQAPGGVPYAEWKARQLNELFRERGMTGESGRITPETMTDGSEHKIR